MLVYTYGVFDLLHAGHIRSIKKAKSLGDKLIVGVFTDKVAESFKRKPIIPEEQRKEMLESLKDVDMVIYQCELSPETNIKYIEADIVAKGPGAGFEDMDLPNKVLLDYNDINSTTKIIEKIRCL